jgi:hypothetical protein
MAKCALCGEEIEAGVIHGHAITGMISVNKPLLDWILKHGDEPMPPEVEAAAKQEAYRMRLDEVFGREATGANL